MSITDPDRLKTFGLLHYGLHVTAFAAIALPAALGYPRGYRWVLVWLVVSLLGYGTELFEHLSAKDVLEWDDVLTNSGGALLGVLIGGALFEHLRQRGQA